MGKITIRGTEDGGLWVREGTSEAPEDIINELREVLEDANSLFKSAHSIAQRKGLQTNWEAFAKQLEASLERQYRVLHPAATKDRDFHQHGCICADCSGAELTSEND